jgi:uncharacterized protein (TIGR03083 family)
MDTDEVWRHIDEQRSALADILEGLPDEAWREPSLCAEWTVRDVAAHLAMSQARVRDVLWPMLRSGFRFNVMVREAARRSPADHEEIIATIRGFVGSRRRAPGVTELEPLLDILIHTQDICVPLGIDHAMPPEAAATSADRVLAIGPPFRLRAPFRGVRFEATDINWVHGDGAVVKGPMQWILLTLAGREVAHSYLEGETRALAGRD